MAKVDKLIVTNLAALRAKYGTGLTKIKTAVSALIAADAARGLTTKLLALDDAAAMKKLKARPVTKAKDPKQNKIAIDGAYAALVPDYVMILGAVDVVPHQDLSNPLYSTDPDGDDDPIAFGDIPYACEEPYNRDPGKFRGPSRVVGRLPDLTGGKDPAYLVGLLTTAASYRIRPRSAYDAYFGLSNKVWQKSTALSLRNVFGSDGDLQTSPKLGPKWPPKMLARRAHFINCHGAPVDPFFYGETPSDYPQAHAAKIAEKHVVEGTVMTAECCYGGELYDPENEPSEQRVGLCNTYLKKGAYGVFASTTIAYGPSEGNGSADLICQYFLEQVLAGASLGRAALEARQRFVERATLLDPADLKTLAQFNLLGDPAVHAVQAAQGALTKTKAYRAAFKELAGRDGGRGSDGKTTDLPVGRELRRERLMRKGMALPTIVATVRKLTSAPPKRIKDMLARAARESKMSRVRFSSFAAQPLKNGVPQGAKRLVAHPSDVYVAIGGAPLRRKDSKVKAGMILTATVKNGELVRLRRLHAK